MSIGMIDRGFKKIVGFVFEIIIRYRRLRGEARPLENRERETLERIRSIKYIHISMS